MTIRPNVRKAALLGALTAVAVSAWATNHSYNSVYVPAYVERPVVVVAPSNELVVVDSLTADEVVVVPAPVVVERRVVQPAITIEERRLSEDERIQLAVMDRIATNPRISGKIGVESRDSVVKLSGYTRTVGQARHAEQDARSVLGVKYVQNEIRPRVGGSV